MINRESANGSSPSAGGEKGNLLKGDKRKKNLEIAGFMARQIFQLHVADPTRYPLGTNLMAGVKAWKGKSKKKKG